MAIIDMFKQERKSSEEGFLSEVSFVEEVPAPKKKFSKDALLSILCVRFFFFALFLCTTVWFSYTLCKVALCSFVKLCLWGTSESLNLRLSKSWLSLKRSFICGIALLLALLSPSLGIMIACAYFLMYDKSGVEEVVPSSLREQFKDLFAQGGHN